ncbi:BON domain-containing protein [Balneatrix alpica]|uniref:BON domain-containing protein n=1 Tax=Balneatrix alpica TaxID=75684 RepID=A0ABV5Z9V1_9GAMM|nr:BON domain-containing protein [Balneatrix alpica]
MIKHITTHNLAKRTQKLLTLGLLSSAVLLTACSESTAQEQTAGQKVDAAINQVEQSTAQASNKLEQGASELKQDVTDAAAAVKAEVEDAAITAAINAELARDAELNAWNIDVDTEDGKVVLSGKAPNDQARERATRIAAQVEGVMKVENRLTLEQS